MTVAPKLAVDSLDLTREEEVGSDAEPDNEDAIFAKVLAKREKLAERKRIEQLEREKLQQP